MSILHLKILLLVWTLMLADVQMGLAGFADRSADLVTAESMKGKEGNKEYSKWVERLRNAGSNVNKQELAKNDTN